MGFGGRIFAGRPEVDAPLKTGPNALSAQEQAFLDNEVRTLCAMFDDLAIHETHEMPPEVRHFACEKRFFRTIIPMQ